MLEQLEYAYLEVSAVVPTYVVCATVAAYVGHFDCF